MLYVSQSATERKMEGIRRVEAEILGQEFREDSTEKGILIKKREGEYWGKGSLGHVTAGAEGDV